MSNIRIAIADDYAIIRDGIKVGLSRDRDLQVVLEAESGESLISGLETTPVDVILMDLKMPGMDGMETMTAIHKKYPDIRVLIITMYDDEKFIIHLMEKGANGYLLKNAESDEIRKAIYTAHETGYYFNDTVNKALLKRLVLRSPAKPSFRPQVEFTERELQVLHLICEEKTNAEIGKTIFLSPRSVEGIRQRLIDKTGARNTVGLVIWAVRNGIIC